jgi:hypothetical protein
LTFKNAHIFTNKNPQKRGTVFKRNVKAKPDFAFMSPLKDKIWKPGAVRRPII